MFHPSGKNRMFFQQHASIRVFTDRRRCLGNIEKQSIAVYRSRIA